MEFKGTKGGWYVESMDDTFIRSKASKVNIATMDGANWILNESRANALLISKAPEMLDMLNKARIELSRIKSSMMAHPDCTIGSEFDDYTSSAQECENEIELLIKEATEL